jgi:hypothetical protein
MASVDDVLELLGDERRRYALYYLMEDDGSDPTHVDELTRAVARMRSEDDETVPEGELTNLKVNLHHVQMPKADEAAFVEYDGDDRTVSLVGEPPEFEALATVAEVIERDGTGEPADAVDRIDSADG